MEKVDQINAKLLAMEVMVSALAETAPNKEQLRQSFQRGVDATMAVSLANDVGDDLVEAVLAHLEKFGDLMS